MTETMTTKTTKPVSIRERAKRLFAKVRQRQLVTARHGNVRDSFRYARRAERIRKAVGCAML